MKLFTFITTILLAWVCSAKEWEPREGNKAGSMPISIGSEISAVSKAHKTVIVSVEPETIDVLPNGSTFKDSIYVSGITTPCLYAWEVKLYFTNTVLNCDSVKEGPFLKQGGTTFYGGGGINNTTGLIHPYCTCLNPNPGVTGNGIICYIFWKVVGSGNSVLDINYPGFPYPVKLGDPSATPIPCEATDGYYNPPPQGVETISPVIPDCLSLQTYPNPFSPGKVGIRLFVNLSNSFLPNADSPQAKTNLRLAIYDLTGRVVKSFGPGDPKLPELNNSMNPITVVWDGKDGSGKLLPSGIYFCKLQVGDESITKQLFLLR